jgi:hypothetical protein
MAGGGDKSDDWFKRAYDLREGEQVNGQTLDRTMHSTPEARNTKIRNPKP